MTAAIIAGGENTRIGTNKSFLRLYGRPIIEIQLEILGRIFDKIVISTNEPELFFRYKMPLIGDIFAQKGPLCGVLSVLSWSKEDEIFAIGCDMPFINSTLIRHIIDNREHNITVPMCNGRPEPLFSVYSKGIIDSGVRLLSHGRGLSDLIAGDRVKHIEEAEVRAIDPEGRSFVNINTPEEFKEAANYCR